MVEAKERTPYGQWGPWLKANFEFHQRTAQLYMEIYSGWELLQQNAKSISDLSLTQAIGLLRAIDPPQEAAITQDQATAITRELPAGPVQWAGVEAAGEEPTEPAEEPTEEDREDAEERHRAQQRKRPAAMFMEADGRVSNARRELKKALDAARDVEFSDEEVELLVRQGEAARDMASLFIAAVSGDAGTDWDAELYELEQRRQWGPEGEPED